MQSSQCNAASSWARCAPGEPLQLPARSCNSFWWLLGSTRGKTPSGVDLRKAAEARRGARDGPRQTFLALRAGGGVWQPARRRQAPFDATGDRVERAADQRGGGCLSFGYHSISVVGCSVGSCNSTHAWPSSNTRGWNSIYASSTPSGCDSSHSWSWISRGRCCQPSTGRNSSKRRCSEEVERHARGGSHDQVEGEACHQPTG